MSLISKRVGTGAVKPVGRDGQSGDRNPRSEPGSGALTGWVNRGGTAVRKLFGALAAAMLTLVLLAPPAEARCWWNGYRWHCHHHRHDVGYAYPYYRHYGYYPHYRHYYYRPYYAY